MRQQIKSPAKRNGFSFFKGFLTHPGLVASIVPSSRFLEQRLVKLGAVSKARLVVELGPGTGGTTKALLQALPQESSLLAIELNPDFIPLLKAFNDPRLIVHSGSAADLGKALSLYGLPKPDLVVSGIPFSTMPLELGQKILGEIWDCLAPEGRFIAYQFRDRVARLGRNLMGKPSTGLELLNVPPVRLYSWLKTKN